MAAVTGNYGATHHATPHVTTRSASARVVSILRLTFGLVPIVAGADKFTHLLVNWDQYLAPEIATLLPFEPHSFMLAVGVIEVIAGLVVLFRPRLGSMIVCLWLLGIAFNLLIAGYYDIAVRDAVMAIAAFCLFILTGPRRDSL